MIILTESLSTWCAHTGTWIWINCVCTVKWPWKYFDSVCDSDCVLVLACACIMWWLCVSILLYPDIDECAAPSGNPCMNGGSCVNNLGGFSCTCVSGHTGTLCETGMVIAAARLYGDCCSTVSGLVYAFVPAIFSRVSARKEAALQDIW